MATIPGTSNPDMLDGTSFDDTITAKGGDDTVFAWSGADVIDLGSGNDRSENGLGNDTVYGGLGNDTVFAGGGNDVIYGAGGRDEIIATDLNNAGIAMAYGGANEDAIAIYSTAGGTLDGGSGKDQLQVFNATDESLLVDLDSNLFDGGAAFAPGVTFQSFERLVVVTGSGNDTILGGNQADYLTVGSGANTVNARAGDDTVAYDAGVANTLRGGKGVDTLIVSNSFYFITKGDGTVDDGSLSDILGFERFVAIGTEFDDIVGLGDQKDSFKGAEGNDTAFGRDGADKLYGESGADSLDGGQGRDVLRGGSGNDSILGDLGNDRISGGIGDDSIMAGSGDDRIRLGAGSDTVTGGSGADTFQFAGDQSGSHTITDFETGIDSLQIAGLYLQLGPAPGPLDPSLLSFGAATGPQAQFVLTYSALTDMTTLRWDSNGDDPTDVSYAVVTLSGQIALTASDILIL